MVGFAINANAQSKVVIKGTIKGDLKGYNKIYVFGDNIQEDSTIVKNGHFSISIPYVKDAIPYIHAEYDTKVKKGPQAFPVVIDRPCTVNIEVTDVNKGLRAGKISGNNAAIAFQAFEQGREQLRDDMRATVAAQFPNKPPGDSSYNKAFVKLLQERMIPYINNFVETNANNYVGAFILGRYQAIIPQEDLEKLYNKLGKAQKSTAPANEVQGRLVGFKRAVTGFEVRDFSLNTPKDQAVAFSSFRGKYVLIDFWSSWCGPCKAAFPHMKELYEKYRSDKFEILGISIDTDKAAWLKELDKQKLPWPQLLDTKNISINSFAVTAVPTAYLISPDGKIMMKQVGFGEEGDSEIEVKLKELFGK